MKKQNIEFTQISLMPEVCDHRVSHRYSTMQVGRSWIAKDAAGTVIVIAGSWGEAEKQAREYYLPIATVIDPERGQVILNHTYRISTADRGFDIVAQDVNVALSAVGIKPEKVNHIKVWKSSGKIMESGQVGAGWGKCTELSE